MEEATDLETIRAEIERLSKREVRKPVKLLISTNSVTLTVTE